MVSGAATRFGDNLAKRTAWSGHFINGQDPRYRFLIGEVIVNIFLWVFLIVAAGAGLSGTRPQFWRRFVWPTALHNAVVMVGVVCVILVFHALWSPRDVA